MLDLCFTPFPSLTTSRLDLRRITLEDAGRLYKLRSDVRVMRYINRPQARSEEDAVALIEKIDNAIALDDGITWGIFEKGARMLLGTIGFWRIEKENFRAEIGYLLCLETQGKGYMSEAIQEVIRFGFIEMGLHSIEARVDPANEKSMKLLEKSGFIQEAFLKENAFFDGRFTDSAIYSLLEDTEGIAKPSSSVTVEADKIQ